MSRDKYVEVAPAATVQYEQAIGLLHWRVQCFAIDLREQEAPTAPSGRSTERLGTPSFFPQSIQRRGELLPGRAFAHLLLVAP